MSARSRRAVALVAVAFLLVAGGLAALYLTNRREVTTTSAAAYEAYRDGVANERRFYMKDAQVGYAKALELDPNFAMAMLRLAAQSSKEQAVSLIDRASRLRGRLNDRERLYVDMAQAQMSGNLEGDGEHEQERREHAAHEVPSEVAATGMHVTSFGPSGRQG